MSRQSSLSHVVEAQRAGYYHAAPASDVYTLVDALSAIWRQRRLVLATFALTLAAVLVITLLMKKTYLSESQIFVRLGRENTILDVPAGLGERAMYAPPISRDAEINSIAVMMVSKELFGRVVDQVGAERILGRDTSVSTGTESAANPQPQTLVGSLVAIFESLGILDKLEIREKAIIHLQKTLEVSANKQTHVISVRYENYEPRLAQEVVATLVSEYEKQHSRSHRSHKGSEFVERQVHAAQTALYSSEMAFEQFKSQTKMLSAIDQRRVFVDRIARIENEQLDVGADLEALEAEVGKLELLLGEIPQTEPIQTTAGSGNAAIDGMRQELFRLEVQREELLAKYQPQHPQLKLLDRQLENARKVFETAENQLVESVEGPSRIYEGARLQLIQRVPIRDSLKSKQVELRNQLQQVLADLAKFNEQETEFFRLQRDLELRDDEYKRLEKTWRQANFDLAMQEQNISNLSIVQPATFNPKPYRPNKLINLAVGIALGLLLGCGLATLWDLRLGSQQIPRLEGPHFPLPLLAELPWQASEELVETS